ncbi:tetratricopeptide repeat protein [Streptomyces marincola]|uniref:tetratricopeptide repeat protein n=1 Tax=Streptomyces marincola TaxID=2878388 RepID=UPI0034CE0CC5
MGHGGERARGGGRAGAAGRRGQPRARVAAAPGRGRLGGDLVAGQDRLARGAGQRRGPRAHRALARTPRHRAGARDHPQGRGLAGHEHGAAGGHSASGRLPAGAPGPGRAARHGGRRNVARRRRRTRSSAAGIAAGRRLPRADPAGTRPLPGTAALCELGRPGDALPLAERALSVSESALGPDHPRARNVRRWLLTHTACQRWTREQEEQ